ncbi:MAG: MotA/TolQ/ExbB proton channel family protein [Candidatus Chromulinivorax sp.]
MTSVFQANSMWSLVAQGDMMTKFILLLLFSMSVLSWSIALYKFVLFKIKMHQLQQVSLALKDVQDFKTLFSVMQQHVKTMPGYFVSRCLKSLKELLQIKDAGKQEYAQTTGIDFFQMQISQVLDELMFQEQAYVSMLSATAGVGPLLGLLGTVWGLVHSFMSISQKQSADIVTVAPGIAEALITTIAGLLVAIPAVMLFYYVMGQVQQIEQQLNELADHIIVIARNLVIGKDNSGVTTVDNQVANHQELL